MTNILTVEPCQSLCNLPSGFILSHVSWATFWLFTLGIFVVFNLTVFLWFRHTDSSGADAPPEQRRLQKYDETVVETDSEIENLI